MIAAQPEPISVAALPAESRARVLTPQAVQFLLKLSRRFEPCRRRLLEDRRVRQGKMDDGYMPDFPAETFEIRKSPWKVAETPADLLDRRVEITGPTDRKTILQALNSGASVFVADFEDSNSPTWSNMIEGQRNLQDAVNGTITYESPEGKRYALCEVPAVLMVRPRGWHLVEKHFCVDGQSISASLFDFGLFFFHNARALSRNGSGPYFYLPKLESRDEARLWNEVFVAAQQELAVPRGTIRATVLIETVPAAFEMDEILWELREHAAGLACGRRDYIFSYIKKFRNHGAYMLPDRSSIAMTRHFLASYAELLIATGHRRGAHAIGGMAANQAVLPQVREDKLREVWAGHDGTGVAHPGLVPVAKSVFDIFLAFPNQLHRPATGCAVNSRDLLTTPTGAITSEGLRNNLDVGLRYLAAWLAGDGCVPINNLIEGAATAEICRAQVWQWLRHGAWTESQVTDTFKSTIQGLRRDLSLPTLELAGKLYEEMLYTPEFPEFLTARAYDCLD